MEFGRLVDEYELTRNIRLLDPIEAIVQEMNAQRTEEESRELDALHSLLELSEIFPTTKIGPLVAILKRRLPKFALTNYLEVDWVTNFASWMREAEYEVTYGSLHRTLGLYALFMLGQDQDAAANDQATQIATFIRRYSKLLNEGQKHDPESKNARHFRKRHGKILGNIRKNQEEYVASLKDECRMADPALKKFLSLSTLILSEKAGHQYALDALEDYDVVLHLAQSDVVEVEGLRKPAT